MEKEIYLANPCKASSLPFWKTNRIEIPADMRILLEEDLWSFDIDEYTDEKYFKLIHRMNDVEKPALASDYELVCVGIREYAEHIADCYDDIGISCEELARYQSHIVYDSSLWVAIRECVKNTIIASGIAEFDDVIKEGVLEWIQVSADYRRKGLGRFIVRELLWRLRDKADFVTVSGKVDNPTNPKGLYVACGFSEEEIWHVLRKR